MAALRSPRLHTSLLASRTNSGGNLQLAKRNPTYGPDCRENSAAIDVARDDWRLSATAVAEIGCCETGKRSWSE